MTIDIDEIKKDTMKRFLYMLTSVYNDGDMMPEEYGEGWYAALDELERQIKERYGYLIKED